MCHSRRNDTQSPDDRSVAKRVSHHVEGGRGTSHEPLPSVDR